MAIDTRARRNASLLDECGILSPDGGIDASDRQTLVGDYLTSGSSSLIFTSLDPLDIPVEAGVRVRYGFIPI